MGILVFQCLDTMAMMRPGKSQSGFKDTIFFKQIICRHLLDSSKNVSTK